MVSFTVLEPGKYLRARGSVSYTPQQTLARTRVPDTAQHTRAQTRASTLMRSTFTPLSVYNNRRERCGRSV